jgi:hypothetical protein
MTRAVAFLAAALLAATLGAAQNAPTGAAAGSQSSGDVSGQSKTITGCLSSSSLGDNHFKLTDENGKVYSLTGLTDQLTSHAGQQVRVTGIDNSKSSSAPNGYDSPNPSAGSAQDDGSGTGGNSGSAATPEKSGRLALQVTAVEKLADHCPSSGARKPEGAEVQAERASAQVRLISYKAVAATDDDGTLAGSSDGGQSSSTQTETAAQTGTPDQAGHNDLPRTATALPLLGILGLGSLVAGFIVRR